MAAAKKKPKNNIRLSAESMELIKEIAVESDLSAQDAANKMIKTGFSRIQALSRYAAKDRE